MIVYKVYTTNLRGDRKFFDKSSWRHMAEDAAKTALLKTHAVRQVDIVRVWRDEESGSEEQTTVLVMMVTKDGIDRYSLDTSEEDQGDKRYDRG